MCDYVNKMFSKNTIEVITNIFKWLFLISNCLKAYIQLSKNFKRIQNYF